MAHSNDDIRIKKLTRGIYHAMRGYSNDECASSLVFIMIHILLKAGFSKDEFLEAIGEEWETLEGVINESNKK
jgi:hypothetical protein